MATSTTPATTAAAVHLLSLDQATNVLVLAYGNKFAVFDSRNGSPLALPESSSAVGSNVIKIADDEFPKAPIRAVAFSPANGLVVFAADDKSLSCWSVKNWTKLGSRETIKRVNSIVISADNEFVIVADKFGDVYKYSLKDLTDSESLILGHVSMTTQIAASADGKYLITADRDEKIRVSHYPYSFEIECFCLGHKQFISDIEILDFSPKVLVSGGGDDFVLSWDFQQGTVLDKFDLRGVLNKGEGETVTVTRIRSCKATRTIALIVEKSPSLLLLTADDSGKFSLRQRLELASDVFDVAFDSQGRMFVAYGVTPKTEGSPVNRTVDVMNFNASTHQYSLPTSEEPLVKAIIAAGTNTAADKVPDFYATGQLRKVWYPKDTKGQAEDEDEEDGSKRKKFKRRK
ncbi:WD repeat-containing protein 4 [Quaeritorhiza haematococci]|nr:WD repeat-containing protein 4 [Quaeritorhiza haematococci]